MSRHYRTALVTGASSGIGAALAARLCAEGIEVVLAARRVDTLDAIADDLRAKGGKARVAAIDVARPKAAIAEIQRIDAQLDGLDLVVANAGVAPGRWSGKLAWEDCEGIIDVNVAGATATLVAVLPRMVERGRGHLVGISSIAAFRGLPKFAAYSASKAYLSAFLEGVRVDLRGTGVHVTDVRPGYIKTALNAGNDKLPFMMSAEAAAATIWKAIRAQRSMIAFPFPTAAAMRTAAIMPRPVYARMMGGKARG
jgi:short-subunit dehydrogenase